MDAQFAKIMEHLGAYAEAQRLVTNAHNLCVKTVRTWLKAQPDADAAYRWLASDPLAAIGVTVPQEVLDALAPVLASVPGHEDEISF